jgi:SAM-dependent methyltransferase
VENNRTVRFLNRFERSWDLLGKKNSLGAILTGDEGGIREWNLEEFLATGRSDAQRFIADLERIAPAVSRARALDFGCGVGRVTRALAAYFDRIVGADIAPSMVSQARRLNGDITNASFILNPAPHLRQFQPGSFDVIYCRLVLQHLRPRRSRRYVTELIRVLAPHGIMMVQIPGDDCVDSEEAFCNAPVTGFGLKRYAPMPLVRAYRRLKYRLIVDYALLESNDPRMHMFAISKEEMTRLIRKSGGEAVVVTPDQSHGPRGQGFEYWVTRRA